ncbi:glucose-6-phosphate isomerase [Advenella sp. S44]|uniref:glucose-6-phosphate isomerase n=1 Tax=Advenella sp. S44 TaxID=1982755 RepID=UPI000C29750C|nr:glucose-6-phosphate isomerase [Advenella sp. S44]PJX25509.1 glucose-6-phosphate isomerase [Advenella sp. S44]
MPQWQAYVKAIKEAPRVAPAPRIIEAGGMQIDLTAQTYSADVLNTATALLQARDLTGARQALFDGEHVNTTENRAAWHTQLRAPRPIEEVAEERKRALEFVRRSDSERRWRNIVHIGIGGSDWGVRLVVGAFGYASIWRNIRFVANIDGHAVEGGLAGLDPRETLIVVASKSFKTAETLENANRAIEWMQAAGIAKPLNQVIAVTANPQAAQAWGLLQSQIFRFWDWVGGRFSIWSAVGVAAGLAVGSDVVAGLQSGAKAMDDHFMTAPIEQNAPVQLAMAGIANRSILDYGSLNISAYDSRLANLIPYIQQLEMESLGKSVDINGQPITVPTGPAVWGMPGTDAQHTFFQWLHQGSDGAPVDFIACQHEDHAWKEHHIQLLAHCLAQREALMNGKTYEQAVQESIAAGMSEAAAREVANHKVHPGGRPSNLIMMPSLTPFSLGALLALYEHKVFVQGLVWGLNPFDQWGVEYGKVLATDITAELKGAPADASHDASTRYWIERIRSQME